MKPLNTTDLAYFAQIVRSGSFARAAGELGLSQPALSKSVKKLEGDLGVRLLDRTARGVIPTPFGDALFMRAAAVLADLRSAIEEIDSLRGAAGGTVTVGIAPAVAAHFMPAITEELRKSGRSIVLRVNEGLVDSLFTALRTSAMDFAITTRTAVDAPGDLLVEPLFEDTFVVCCAPGHPLVGKSKIEPWDLAELAWVLAPRGGILRSEFDARFQSRDAVPPNAIVETASGVFSKALVMNGAFLSLLPRELVSHDERKGFIHVLAVPWLEWNRQIALVRRRNRTSSKSANFVISVVQSVARTLRQSEMAPTPGAR